MMQTLIANLRTMEVRLQPLAEEATADALEPRLLLNFYRYLVEECESMQFLKKEGKEEKEIVNAILETVSALPQCFPERVVDEGLDRADELLEAAGVQGDFEDEQLARCVLLLVYLDAFYRTKAEMFLQDGKKGGLEGYLFDVEGTAELARRIHQMDLWGAVVQEREAAFLSASLGMHAPPGYAMHLIAEQERLGGGGGSRRFSGLRSGRDIQDAMEEAAERVASVDPAVKTTAGGSKRSKEEI